jgi:hypothetical protein
VSREIVQNDHVAGLERWRQHLLSRKRRISFTAADGLTKRNVA